ncbi:MAG: serine/threonine-protein kinase [Planctomycetota bacterium]
MQLELERFLDEFWQHVDQGCVQPLAAYQTRYPEAADAIAREYALYQDAHVDLLPEDEPYPTAPGDTEDASAPCTIGRYQVSGRLARGGMSTLLRARDPELGREVVLKTLKPQLADDPRALARFEREARLAGQLEHPYVCPVLDVLHAGSTTYVVLPLLKGATLDQFVTRARTRGEAAEGLWALLAAGDSGLEPSSRNPTPFWRTETSHLPAVLLLLERVAHGVHAAHEAGIVHRDLKPSNIMVQRDGTPVVLDFGLATRAGEGTSITLPGDVLGTPAYMAPEQLDGRPDAIDRRTDVHALGVILYELLTLARPYDGDTEQALFVAIRRGEPVSPRRRNPTLTRDLEAVCVRAMAPEPSRRYATAEAFAHDLANVRLLRRTTATPVGATSRLLRRARRNPLATSLTGAALLMLAALVWSRIDRERAADRRTEAGAAIEGISQAHAHGKAPSPQDLSVLEQVIPDATVREPFLQNPLDAMALTAVLRKMLDTSRGGEDTGDVVCLAPRGAITETRPWCRFRTVVPTNQPRAYTISFVHLDPPEQHNEQSFTHVRGAGEEVSFRAETDLKPGSWRWTVRLDRSGEMTPWQPGEFEGHVEFEIVRPETIDALRGTLPSTGSELLDRHLEAATLLRHNLAQEALDRLALHRTEDLPLVDQARDLLLQVRACAIIGDRDRLDSLAKRWHQIAEAQSPDRPGEREK